MNYKNSRDAAWQMLIKNKVTSLPVSVNMICESEGIRLFTYREGLPVIQSLKLQDHMIGNDAFSIDRVIFYDDCMPLGRQRFSIAHEIGHIVLHESDGATVHNREMSPGDDPKETEANIFASRLLAPICVLHFVGVCSPEEIAELCNISITAARYRFERLCLLRRRDDEQRTRTGRGCFLLSTFERKVYKRFKGYIRENKR